MVVKRKSAKKPKKPKTTTSTGTGSSFTKKSVEAGKKAIAAVGTNGGKTTKRKKPVKKK
jgi:hypothetical protein